MDVFGFFDWLERHVLRRTTRADARAAEIEDVIFLLDDTMRAMPREWPGWDRFVEVSEIVNETAKKTNTLRRRLRRKGMPGRCHANRRSFREWRDYLISLEP